MALTEGEYIPGNVLSDEIKTVYREELKPCYESICNAFNALKSQDLDLTDNLKATSDLIIGTGLFLDSTQKEIPFFHGLVDFVSDIPYLRYFLARFNSANRNLAKITTNFQRARIEINNLNEIVYLDSQRITNLECSLNEYPSKFKNIYEILDSHGNKINNLQRQILVIFLIIIFYIVYDFIEVDSKVKKIYIVKSGDTLSEIAVLFYKDYEKENVIYEANKKIIGASRHKIKAGQVLQIPASND